MRSVACTNKFYDNFQLRSCAKNGIYDSHTPTRQKLQDTGCSNFARIKFPMEFIRSPMFIENWEGWIVEWMIQLGMFL